MSDRPDIAFVAALLGDPTRSRMLTVLMDGRAQTATELALEGGVSASTASSHLARLTVAGFVTLAKQGRHRYFRIAAPEVAAAIEGLMGIAPRGRARPARTGACDEGLRRARVCYDHLAGEAGVRLLERLRERHFVGGSSEAIELTRAGERWCREAGIDLETLRAKRRPLCRSCLDWSERRIHLAGALGAALLDRLFDLCYARRGPGSRAVIVSSRGEAFIERLDPSSLAAERRASRR
jgi:DNA-binding transcriptional ArsR family regulator